MVGVSGLEQDEAGCWWYRFPDGRRMRAKEFECSRCGIQFHCYRPDRQYCSRQCKCQAVVSKGYNVTCQQCKSQFITKDARQKFCSHSCAATSMHSRGAVTTAGDVSPVNARKENYSRDTEGQWWYQGRGKDTVRTRAYILTCKACDSPFLANIFHRRKQQYCSRKCSPHPGNPNGKPPVLKGDKNPRWKGGRQISRGYVLIFAPDHPTRIGKMRKYVFEHRLVMEKMLGRILTEDETVHHKNGIRDDNRPENLELWASSHPYGQRAQEKATTDRERLRVLFHSGALGSGAATFEEFLAMLDGQVKVLA